jgi:hypothetical protein
VVAIQRVAIFAFEFLDIAGTTGNGNQAPDVDAYRADAVWLPRSRPTASQS